VTPIEALRLIELSTEELRQRNQSSFVAMGAHAKRDLDLLSSIRLACEAVLGGLESKGVSAPANSVFDGIFGDVATELLAEGQSPTTVVGNGQATVRVHLGKVTVAIGLRHAHADQTVFRFEHQRDALSAVDALRKAEVEP
jgi:hypothetical protein